MAADLEALRKNLKEANEQRTFDRKRPESKAEKIRALKREIAALRTKGATWADVAEILKGGGLEVSADTVRQAMAGEKKAAHGGGRSTGAGTGVKPRTKRGAGGNASGHNGGGQTNTEPSGGPKRGTGASAVTMPDEL